jgi:diaminohydroxyphosphoribosylaminopyrimidine deaminase/5-amino-6-(5-phosphoribosylamino)uracil reductase
VKIINLQAVFIIQILNHQTFMRRCLQLAQQGMGHVAPNPIVGSLLVHNGKIISEGYHAQYGGPHAEVNALTNVTDPAILSESTLYVSLEPCSHFGKTPPCANLIIDKGIKNVVIACTDPNPKVAGSGIKLLQDAGINVTSGILEHEAIAGNRRFVTYHTHQRPYIILKWAQTADGYIDKPRRANETGSSTPLSSLPSHRLVHLWRSHEQAILVGKNTVVNDNPALTVRLVDGNNPTRIVIDSNASLRGDLKIFDQTAQTLVINHKEARIAPEAEWVLVDKDKNLLEGLMNILYQRNITSVLVEGGAETLNHFIAAGMWDEARIFNAPMHFRGGIKAPVIPPLTGLTSLTHRSGLDTLHIVYKTIFAPPCIPM